MKFISSLLADDNLTRKAYLNALASVLDYGANIVVGFLVTPLLVAGLGDYSYGMWRVLQRVVGYITPATGRPSQALRYTLANRQASDDFAEKRGFVGSAVTVWVLFLPVMLVLGGVLVWLTPVMLSVPAEYVWSVRFTIWLLVANLSLYSLASIPQSALQGENRGYKRMGLSVLLVFISGGLSLLAIYLDTGLVGVALADLVTSLLTGLFFLQVVRQYAPWFGINWPPFSVTLKFLGLSGWFLGWNLIMNLMLGGDVVVLGTFVSVESVTAFTLTKYAPEMLISVVSIIIFGIAPGLGGIIGSGQHKRAASLRGEILMMTWLVLTVLGTSILLWNRTFIRLWVGAEYFAGTLPNLLMIVMVVQFVLMMCDGNIIDLTLQIRRKVLLGGLATLLSFGLASLFTGYFGWSYSGVCLGFILGRLILSIGYPIIVGRTLMIPFLTQLRGGLRAISVTVLFFTLAGSLDHFAAQSTWLGGMGWVGFIVSAGLGAGILFLMVFFLGLTRTQQQILMRRLQVVTTLAPKR